jgi:L-fuconate dehydratase
VAEYVDHLHEHFIAPPVVQNGMYMPPAEPGFSIQMTDSTLAAHLAPLGVAAA